MTLRVALLMRGAFNLLVALYLLIRPEAAIQAGAGRNGYYALADAVLALLLARALAKDPRGRWLVALALVDALVRLLTGVAVFAFPSIESRVLSAVLFFGGIVTVSIALGVAGMLYTVMRRGVPGTATVARIGGALPAFILSACSLLFGLALVTGIESADDRRILIALFALAIGLTLGVTGLRTRPSWMTT